MKGTFESFDATLTTAEDRSASSVTATIDIASINTNNKDRDGHLQTNDFFLASEHPQMTFRSTSFEPTGDDEFRVHGDLTLRGVTKPVVLDAELGGTTVDPYGQTKIGFSAKTKIDRTEFGVTWNAALETGGVLVSEKIKLEFDVSAIKNA